MTNLLDRTAFQFLLLHKGETMTTEEKIKAYLDEKHLQEQSDED